MRLKIFLLSFFLFHVLFVFGQKSEKIYFLNQFSISINRNLPLNGGLTKNRFGFGFGAYRYIPHSSIFLGAEFNRINYLNKSEYHGHFSNVRNVNYNLCYLSFIPIGLNFDIMNKKMFVEINPFCDIILFSKVEGTSINYFPSFATNKFIDKNNLQGLSNVGFSLGLGLKLPFSKTNLFVKPDIKIGFWGINSDNYISDYYYRLLLIMKIK